MPALLTSIIAAFVLAAAPVSAAANSAITVQFDPKAGTLTLRAREVPLSEVLTQLQKQAGLEIVVPDLEDRRVSISVTKQPLAQVIEQLLPTGTRYLVLTGDKEVVISSAAGTKVGRRPEPPETLPKKGDRNIVPIDPQGTRKKPPLESPSGAVAGPDLKRAPDKIDIPGTPAPEVAAPEPTPAGTYARFRFTLTEEQITLESGQRFHDTYVSDDTLVGDYVYAFEVSGRVLAVGSFLDPLIIHSHYSDPKQPHGVLEAKSGRFSVYLPEVALDQLASGRLHIYRVAAEPPTLTLTPETFERFRRVILEVQVIPGEELVRVLDASKQPRRSP